MARSTSRELTDEEIESLTEITRVAGPLLCDFMSRFMDIAEVFDLDPKTAGSAMIYFVVDTVIPVFAVSQGMSDDQVNELKKNASVTDPICRCFAQTLVDVTDAIDRRIRERN